jgi:alpha-galactosidase
MAGIARDAADLAPDALVFNYSNPMTSSVQAMNRFHPVTGLCHGLGDTHRDLAEMIGTPRAETSILYCGLNHLTWIYDFRRHGRDAWPLLRDKLGRDRFSAELFDEYGAYPAPGDRHVTEFFPERFAHAGSYYGRTLGLDAFSLADVLAWGEERYAEMRREAEGAQPLDPQVLDRSSGDQEELIDILRSIMFDTRRISSVNAPNTGFVPNLPTGAVLEVPAVATARGLRPLTVPDFPDALATIVERRLAPVGLTVEAALLGDRDLAVEAMLADGAVSDPDAARALVDRYLSAHAEHLPAFA